MDVDVDAQMRDLKLLFFKEKDTFFSSYHFPF